MTRSNLQAIGVLLVGIGAGLSIAGVGFGADVASLVSKRFVVVWDFFLGMGIVLLIVGTPILLLDSARRFVMLDD